MESLMAEQFAFKSIHEGSIGLELRVRSKADFSFVAEATQTVLALLPRCSKIPRTTHAPKAIHREGEKCPGNTGRTFIRNSSRETTIPSPVTIRIAARFSTIQNDRQAANHPRADAIEPTSVTGTRSASPKSKPISVPAVIPRMALSGVTNFSARVPNIGGMARRLP